MEETLQHIHLYMDRKSGSQSGQSFLYFCMRKWGNNALIN